MALFPSYDDIPYANSRKIIPVTKTLISTFDNQGREKRRRKWLYHKHNVELQYTGRTKAEVRKIWEFFVERHGQYESFHWIDAFEDTYYKVYFATGDGSTVTFDLPCKDCDSTSAIIYRNDSLTPTSLYTINIGAGSDGGDSITFDTAPSTGIRYTMTFTGKIKIQCRFQDDNLSFEQFYKILSSVGLTLVGLHLDE
jgi:hypothetical protein